MEQPDGEVIEQVAIESARIAASDAILNEMTKGTPAGYSYASVEIQSGSQFATYVTPTTYSCLHPHPHPHLTNAIPTLAD
ncbi:hypothetical protein DPMN_061887 [Dreissena polymorpha]|uniref:Uncharacterized protein n=1 Tax=Dreissena polymorpha TaxID=45954 RepID=A0A9D4HIT8_DREPO|nr:hypothetical protein DPMN_061887 [Dreissena polymorpha]